MKNNQLFIDLHVEQKTGNHFSLLFNADNFNTEEVVKKLQGHIETQGPELEIRVNKFCFFNNAERRNPVHAIRRHEFTSLPLVLNMINSVVEYTQGDELRMNTVLGAFEHSAIPVADLTTTNIDSIIADTYYVNGNFQVGTDGQKQDLRKKDLVYREVGRGICVGLHPSHSFQASE